MQGNILPGEPTGSMRRVKGTAHDAYFAPAPAAEGSFRKSAVVLCTDIFGLPLVNSKLLADGLAREIGCDVWVADIFEGKPPFKLNHLKGLSPDRPGESICFRARLKYIWLLRKLPAFLEHPPAKAAERAEAFIKRVKEERGYEKIGVIGYCYGGVVAIILASKADLVSSAVICHPGNCTVEQFKAMKVPTSWQCAEEDSAFKPSLRRSAEAEFRSREGKDSFVHYEFIDHPGTVHGFAARPNMAIAEAKTGFKNSFARSVAWFKETLA